MTPAKIGDSKIPRKNRIAKRLIGEKSLGGVNEVINLSGLWSLSSASPNSRAEILAKRSQESSSTETSSQDR